MVADLGDAGGLRLTVRDLGNGGRSLGLAVRDLGYGGGLNLAVFDLRGLGLAVADLRDSLGLTV